MYKNNNLVYEAWSGNPLKNAPDDSGFGLLISFTGARKAQIYLGNKSAYYRLNQSEGNYNSWFNWQKFTL